jgi:hypothetical protein
MISTYRKKLQNKVLHGIGICAIGIYVCSFTFAEAQDAGLSLSVTPTLFQMNASPEQVWNSSVKVINNNKTPITIYADVVNFAPQGEEGEGKFLPVLTDATEGTTLAEWIDISNESVIIEPEQSYSFPFVVAVPKDAAPGGHFAAILIGTKPPEAEGSIKVSTSQVVTSLFFVRIAGDVYEDGLIREFNTFRSFVDTPKADFEVRFENKGNVHLQPQGEIVITNMWGKERGVIPINQQTHFGNVLPKSIRKFSFSWSGEPSFSDIGRYKAVLTLAYGDDSKKFATSITYFYVIPIKVGLVVLLVLVLFVLFIRFIIKAYIRRMLLLAGIDPELNARSRATRHSFLQEGDVKIIKKVSVRAPVEQGVADLRTQWMGAQALQEKLKALFVFVRLYRVFFLSCLFALLMITLIALFVRGAFESARDYTVSIDNGGTKTSLSSEEILYAEKLKEAPVVVSVAQEKQTYKIVLVNSSEVVGAGASTQRLLEEKGYTVDRLQTDFGTPKDSTVIVYDVSLGEAAQTLSKILGNVLISARPDTSSITPEITVYIGNNTAAQ